jgi:dihydroneopterin aldolase
MSINVPSMWKSTLLNVRSFLRIGIHDHEKGVLQDVLVNVVLYWTYLPLGRPSSVEEVVDYDPVRSFIATWPSLPHHDLIETVLSDLVTLCFSDARVMRVDASIMKPKIFPEAEGAGVSLTITRDAWQRTSNES